MSANYVYITIGSSVIGFIVAMILTFWWMRRRGNQLIFNEVQDQIQRREMEVAQVRQASFGVPLTLFVYGVKPGTVITVTSMFIDDGRLYFFAEIPSAGNEMVRRVVNAGYLSVSKVEDHIGGKFKYCATEKIDLATGQPIEHLEWLEPVVPTTTHPEVVKQEDSGLIDMAARESDDISLDAELREEVSPGNELARDLGLTSTRTSNGVRLGGDTSADDPR
jgi:hypothetical protein